MAQRAASRERIVCSRCDLPYYGDKSGCPYCEQAGLAHGAASESEVVEGATDQGTSTASHDTERESLLGRLKRTLGI